MTTDLRYIISVSNQFITYDVSTSDLVRCVHPKVRGLMMGIVISEDNRFAAAYTNYDQTILLNAITSEFTIIDNPLDDLQTVQGLLLHDNKLIIYGQYRWCIFSTVGKLVDTVELGPVDTLIAGGGVERRQQEDAFEQSHSSVESLFWK